MKFWRKWAYFILMGVVGFLYLNYIDHWQVYAGTVERARSLYAGITGQAGEGSGQSEGSGGASSQFGGDGGSADQPGGNAGSAGQVGGNGEAAGQVGGNAGSAGQVGGNAGSAGQVGGNGEAAGQANGNGGSADQAGGSDGSAGQVGGNAGSAGQVGGNAGSTGQLGQVGGNAGSADQVGGNAGSTGQLGQVGGNNGSAGQPGGSAGAELPGQEEPGPPAYVTVEDDYFSDAVFIGDSRTVGMYEYGELEEIAAFYASTGLTVYKMFDSAIVSVPGQKQKITVEEALQQNSFSKIYLMIGINEMGTGTVETFIDKYREVVEHLQELQPDAIVYIQGIMKVTTGRSNQGDYINNEGIEARNEELERLADNRSVFYLDVNPLLCDDTGGLVESYTFDGVHLKAKYIQIWKDYLKQHAVERD